ncbi:MAG TPA: TIGR04283 family arsenosugar biosynthesis glycosyltransferase [Thermoanaerobaculia bacterium]|nr:TIGR04283 family arsenosugar biosynthesis glycosyltransferase [Thermoanaerobaculia bacterium]
MHPGGDTRKPSSLAVIVPCLNEGAFIEGFLSGLLAREGDFRVILVDGGSADGTWEASGRFSEVTRLRSARGRAVQMNAGARGATEDLLLFLHADTVLPPDAFPRIAEALADPAVAAGSFRLAFDRSDPWLATYSLFSRINHPLFTYGDQGLFVRRELFREVGGFREIPIMEDVEIQRRLRRRGRFVKLEPPVVTSARRFVHRGPVRQQMLNVALVALYQMGMDPARLKRLYDDARPGARLAGGVR